MLLEFFHQFLLLETSLQRPGVSNRRLQVSERRVFCTVIRSVV
jgi:hypothetical protein